MRYLICGGGCYGTSYVRQLLRAQDRGAIARAELIVVDRLPDSPAIREFGRDARVREWICDWEHFGEQVAADPAAFADDQWVPAPIAPHVALHWFRSWMERASIAMRAEPWTEAAPDLPYAQVIREGTLVLSHAPGICPAFCIEPRLCPLTGAARDWEMGETVIALGGSVSGRATVVFRCQHHSFGVGTIPFAEILSEFSRAEAEIRTGADRIVVATVSSCHGIVDMLAVARETPDVALETLR